jgi:hypothetical protein
LGKPKKAAKRTAEDVPRKSSGGDKAGSAAGARRSVAQGRGPTKDPKRTGGALHQGQSILLPQISELTKILGSLDDKIAPEQLHFPVYGNYCGFGHGDPTGNTPPIDAVDAVCREHDLCYGLLGDFDHQCDRHFIEIMPSAIADTPSPVGKYAGLLALLYFSLAEQNLALGETFLKRP